MAFNPVQRCPDPIPEDEFWPVKKSHQLKKKSPKLEEAPGKDLQTESDESHTPSVWEGRLCRRARNPVEMSVKDTLPPLVSKGLSSEIGNIVQVTFEASV